MRPRVSRHRCRARRGGPCWKIENKKTPPTTLPRALRDGQLGLARGRSERPAFDNVTGRALVLMADPAKLTLVPACSLHPCSPEARTRLQDTVDNYPYTPVRSSSASEFSACYGTDTRESTGHRQD
eukprot:jgi/Tetstr1/438202/TSEL_026802.t1